MGIDVYRMPWCDVAKGNQALAQSGLEHQGALARDRLKEPVLGGRGWEKRQSREKAKVGTADRIDGTNASSIAKDRLKDEP